MHEAMIDEKEFQKLKEEHNKAAMWIEFFSNKVHDLEGEIESLKKDIEKSREKEHILGNTMLRLMKEKGIEIPEKLNK